MKLTFKFLSVLSISIIISFTLSLIVSAESSVLTSSDYLVYEPQNLSWNSSSITLSGYFTNVSTNKDIYNVRDLSISINDADNNPAVSTSMNNDDLTDVQIGPGETWKYTIVREMDNFDPEKFYIKEGFTTTVSCEYSVRSHTKDCSYCAARTNTTFETEDTMSEEARQLLLAKIKNALENSSPEQKSYTPTYNPVPYVPITNYEPQKIICKKCDGLGKVLCSSCNGMGYKEHREHSTCLVLHHSDCPGNCHGKCHSKHDYYWVKDKCTICGGDGYKNCSLCHGDGKY